MKIRTMGVKLFHAGGQTDMTKLIVAFHDFVIAPKNEEKIVIVWLFIFYLRSRLLKYAHI